MCKGSGTFFLAGKGPADRREGGRERERPDGFTYEGRRGVPAREGTETLFIAGTVERQEVEGGRAVVGSRQIDPLLSPASFPLPVGVRPGSGLVIGNRLASAESVLTGWHF